MGILLALLLSFNAYALDKKYDTAVSTTKDAVLKATGLEADYFRVRDVATKKTDKWLRANGLSAVAVVGGVAIPILYYKTIRFHTGPFTFTGKSGEVKGVFHLSF